MDGGRLGRVVVIKLGGSVLVDDEAYRQAVQFLVSRLRECSEQHLGYFTEDPDGNPCANHMPWISYKTAYRNGERGCELAQCVALESARQRDLQLVVRKLEGSVPGTVVSSHSPQL
jgi:aspartokinase